MSRLLLWLNAFILLSSCSTLKTPSLVMGHNEDNASVSTSSSDTAIAFDWPVDKARLTRGFIPNARRPHLGLDLAAPRGTPIMAAQAGTVIYTGHDFRGYGKMILIENTNGYATLYAHLDKIMVVEGQKIQRGEMIAGMGRTGHATGYHLHFELRHDRDAVDPLPYLPGGPALSSARLSKTTSSFDN